MGRTKKRKPGKKGCDIDKDDLEFFRVVNAYKKKYGIPFLAMTDYLLILKSLGYVKEKKCDS